MSDRNMTVRELIEHLAQFDSDMEVRIRDPQIPMVLHDLAPHAVEVEKFIDTRGESAAKTRDRLLTGDAKTSFVVALG